MVLIANLQCTYRLHETRMAVPTYHLCLSLSRLWGIRLQIRLYVRIWFLSTSRHRQRTHMMNLKSNRVIKRTIPVNVILTMTVNAPLWYCSDNFIWPQTSFRRATGLASVQKAPENIYWIIFLNLRLATYIPFTFASSTSASCWSLKSGWKKVYTTSECAISSADWNTDFRNNLISGNLLSATVFIFERPTWMPLGRLENL